MYEIYTVLADDTLEGIASKCDILEGDLRKINGFSDNYEVSSGNLLVVPSRDKSNYQYYSVKKGDNIFDIAKKYGVNYEMLLLLNGLDKDDYIYPNQSIMIPKDDVDIYLTIENDTVNDLLKKTNTSIDEVMKYNEKIYLREGQMITFPKK